ncbi:aspartate aminotransferase family protein [Egbenema bharatensis]|uniref:aspartate aminotransferase family protein n=1 Tax=Egbenema bharatensis TaxID=3463334 RepID=UPI003A89A11D
MSDATRIRQRQYLETLIQRYTQRTSGSKQVAQTYRSVLADPRTTEGFNPLTKELCYLIVGKRSSGSKVWDIDGNEYIDVIMGFGANLLGHNPAFIKDALTEQLEYGIHLGPQAEQVGEVAALISELTGMQRVTFSNTGTEAVFTAIRLARAATGREKIAVFSGSYHGHSDGTLVRNQIVDGHSRTVPPAIGVASNVVENVIVLDYGNPQSLEVIQAHRNEIAAVLVEPIQSSRPNLQPKEFLLQLRALTQELGIALIFDEMVTGFRLHLGGAQAWFGVEADIATYGKIVGGGLPIGVIAGKAHYLDQIDGGLWQYGDDSSPRVQKTFFAGTHCKHPLAIAAARAMLTHLKQAGPSLQQELNQRTAQFVEQLNTCFATHEVPIRMAQAGSFFGLASAGNSTATTHEAAAIGMSLLRYHLFDRGVLLKGEGGGFLSTAHTDADLDRIITAARDSIEELQEGDFLPRPSKQLVQQAS